MVLHTDITETRIS